MNKKVTAVVMSLALLTAVPVMARGGGDMGRPGRSGDCQPEERVEQMTKALDLSSDQQEQIKSILEAERPQMTALRDEKHVQRNQLRQAEGAANFHEDSVRAIADAIARIEAEMTVSRVKIQSQINAVLSDEQEEQLKSLREKRGHRPSRPAGTAGE